MIPSTSTSSTLSFPWRFSTQNPECVSHFPILATCPIHLIPFDLTTLITFGEQLFGLIIDVGYTERTCENRSVGGDDIPVGCQGTGRATSVDVYSKRGNIDVFLDVL
jgi:hypothetical protein